MTGRDLRNRQAPMLTAFGSVTATCGGRRTFRLAYPQLSGRDLNPALMR